MNLNENPCFPFISSLKFIICTFCSFLFILIIIKAFFHISPIIIGYYAAIFPIQRPPQFLITKNIHTSVVIHSYHALPVQINKIVSVPKIFSIHDIPGIFSKPETVSADADIGNITITILDIRIGSLVFDTIYLVGPSDYISFQIA